MNRGKSFGIGDFSGIKSKVAYLISSTDTMSMRNKMSSCEIIGESREKFTSLWKKFCAITCCHSTSMLLKLLNYRVNDNQYTTLWLYVNVILMMINILCYNMYVCNIDLRKLSRLDVHESSRTWRYGSLGLVILLVMFVQCNSLIGILC